MRNWRAKIILNPNNYSDAVGYKIYQVENDESSEVISPSFDDADAAKRWLLENSKYGKQIKDMIESEHGPYCELCGECLSCYHEPCQMTEDGNHVVSSQED